MLLDDLRDSSRHCETGASAALADRRRGAGKGGSRRAPDPGPRTPVRSPPDPGSSNRRGTVNPRHHPRPWQERKSNRQVGGGPSGQCLGWLSPGEAQSLRTGTTPFFSQDPCLHLHRAQGAPCTCTPEDWPEAAVTHAHKLHQSTQARVEHRITAWNDLDEPL